MGTGGKKEREKEKNRTHHTARKRKQHAQRIQRRNDHPSQRGHEPGRQAQERDDQQPYAQEDVVICRGGGAAVGLGSDEVPG